ncbi:MAG: nucleotidyltransferase domain-containing protein [Candidatus Bathyarchaeota archaeon]|jgi:predicted nucleotidyltransferase
MSNKPLKKAETIEIIYDAKRWKLLSKLRKKAIKIMDSLNRGHISSVVHGSLARGDVTENSDIDVFISAPPSSFLLETALERFGFSIYRRKIVQATPVYALKGQIEFGDRSTLSFPLVKLRTVEREFYRFGGEASIRILKNGFRNPGVDKRLMLIEPNADGHIESSIVGREEEVANILRISSNTVLDRIRALLRRDNVGRTGIFIEKEVDNDETFEQALKKLADQNPAVRRRMKFYQ